MILFVSQSTEMSSDAVLTTAYWFSFASDNMNSERDSKVAPPYNNVLLGVCTFSPSCKYSEDWKAYT
jgi:hypothetical protein